MSVDVLLDVVVEMTAAHKLLHEPILKGMVANHCQIPTRCANGGCLPEHIPQCAQFVVEVYAYGLKQACGELSLFTAGGDGLNGLAQIGGGIHGVAGSCVHDKPGYTTCCGYLPIVPHHTCYFLLIGLPQKIPCRLAGSRIHPHIEIGLVAKCKSATGFIDLMGANPQVGQDAIGRQHIVVGSEALEVTKISVGERKTPILRQMGVYVGILVEGQ
jgi:hypothetical protein